MNRERGLAKAFIDLADTYAPQFDPLHLFGLLVRRCQELLKVDAAAVMIADARGTLKTMAATDEEVAFVELMQMQTGRGPCMDCYRTGDARSIPDITAERGADGRAVVGFTHVVGRMPVVKLGRSSRHHLGEALDDRLRLACSIIS
ncbi:hypothetical protein QF037_008974 [Streptomyces canus]|nr:hypothetical protein [Streptomyces canus]